MSKRTEQLWEISQDSQAINQCHLCFEPRLYQQALRLEYHCEVCSQGHKVLLLGTISTNTSTITFHVFSNSRMRKHKPKR